MRTLLITLLLLSVKGFSQIPFEVYDDEPESYIKNIVTNAQGDKWLLQCSYWNSKDSVSFGLLYDINKLDSAYARKRVVEKKLKSKLSEDEQSLLEEELSMWELPSLYFPTRKSVDSAVDILKLNVTPVKDDFNKHFTYKIFLTSKDTVDCRHHGTDCFGGVYYTYKLNFFNEKEQFLYRNEAYGQGFDNRQIQKQFSKAVCWTHNNKSLGLIIYYYVDARGVDNGERVFLFSK